MTWLLFSGRPVSDPARTPPGLQNLLPPAPTAGAPARWSGEKSDFEHVSTQLCQFCESIDKNRPLKTGYKRLFLGCQGVHSLYIFVSL